MKPPRRSAAFVVAFLFLASLAFARTPDPGVLGFDPVRLRRLDDLIQGHVDRGQIAGGVMFIARDGQAAHLRAYGRQDIEAGKAMAPDAIMRIASMSKAVTSVAVMMLYEEGKFMLHDPIERYIPAFRGSVVAVAPPKDAPAGTKFVTEKARRPIQIRDLLTHTAGLTYGTGLASDLYKAAKLTDWYFADKDETLAVVIDRLAKLPLHAHPGEAYQYGYSTDVLGRLVEVASGLPLDRFFQERIFAPLKMLDSSFFLPPEKEPRLAKVYGLQGGRLSLGDQGHYVQGPRKCFSGGAGLLSTTGDYARLLQMLLNEGELEGVRLLSRKSVELMRADHVGDKARYNTRGYGLGFWVNTDVGYHAELSSEGAYGWGSAYFPQYLVDPKERIVALFMTQHRPAGGLDLNQKFKVLMYQALK
ncbi:MAG: beta-lactamase family protein [Opitutaceae bacterium]|nr:beta-lactamase family protein [Opitutaceae bacterium]